VNPVPRLNYGIGVLCLLFGFFCAFFRTPLFELYAAVRFSLGVAFACAGLLMFAQVRAHAFLRVLVWVNFFIWAMVIPGDPDLLYERDRSLESSYFWSIAITVFTIAMLFLISKVPRKQKCDDA
jgi:hypothetical protein